MFRNRNFLYGLGCGLIVGAALLQLMFKVDRMENRPLEQSQPATVEKLQAEADKLSYKLVPKEQKLYTDKDIEAIKQKAAEDARGKLAQQPAGTAPQQTQPQTKTIRSVFISERMDASEVAVMLADAQVVANADTLLSALREKKLTTKILRGSYSFEEHTPVDVIVEAITMSNP